MVIFIVIYLIFVEFPIYSPSTKTIYSQKKKSKKTSEQHGRKKT